MPTELTTSTPVASMTSREIAELTGKTHAHVLRDIDKLLGTLNPELVLGFKSSTYEDTTRKSNRYFILDRDSTYCLIAGYDANARMRIIKRWQELEAPKTPGEALVEMAQAFLRHEREITRLSAEQAETKAQVAALMHGEEHFTVVGYANFVGTKLDAAAAAAIGKRVAAICREKGWNIGKARHPVYGLVNTYPRAALDDAWAVH